MAVSLQGPSSGGAGEYPFDCPLQEPGTTWAVLVT